MRFPVLLPADAHGPAAADAAQGRALTRLWGASILLLLAGIAIHLSGLDRPWLLQLHSGGHSAWGAMLWSSLTVLGFGWSCLILILAADRRDGTLLVLTLPALISSSLLAQGLKHAFATVRPAGSDLAVHLAVIGDPLRGIGSTPSGHALAAGATAAMLALSLRAPRSIVSVLALAAAVAWSRAVVGAHWPSDVILGFGLGLACVATLFAWAQAPGIARRLARWREAVCRPRGQRMIAGLEAACAVALLSTRTGYPDGWPAVAALTVLALASAVCRWRAASRMGVA